MLRKKIIDFITESGRSEFDPETEITSYRRAIDAYISTADANFVASGAIKAKATMESRIIETAHNKIKLHVYRPKALDSRELASCIVYLTGSGFVYSNPTWQTRNCIDLAVGTGAVVINIEERTAPEYKFPYGLNECFDAIKWLFANSSDVGINASEIFICGFSSGGNFAAVLARWCMEANLPIKAQYLISPWLDLRCKYQSYDDFAKGYLLDKPVCHWLRKQYVNDEKQYDHPDVSPLLYEKDLKKLARCFIIVGEYEPFRDECRVYASKLQSQGVSVELQVIPGQIHEFGGCNRERLVSDSTDDPIAVVIASIQAHNKQNIVKLVSRPQLTAIGGDGSLEKKNDILSAAQVNTFFSCNKKSLMFGLAAVTAVAGVWFGFGIFNNRNDRTAQSTNLSPPKLGGGE